MIRRFISLFSMILIGLGVLTAPQLAFAKCYSMKEAEAEQGLRIHSELMVIGLNCQHLWPKNQPNLYLQYREFTHDHAKLFADYERTMLAFYKDEGVANPEAKLHQLRTDFANEISEDAARMRPDTFCKAYAPRIPKANKMDNTRLKKWASTVYPNHPVSRAICAKN